MSKAKTTRDFTTQPYTADETRVLDFLAAQDGVGGGPDPIGFLLASYSFTVHQRNTMREALEAVQSEFVLGGQLGELVDEALS